LTPPKVSLYRRLMLFDFDTLAHKDAYKLMTSCIVPRPIAWVVTQSADGVLNAAPFSFFNMFSGNPPVVCIGVGSRPTGEKKDTALNVAETGAFVVNLVSEDLAARMNVTGIDFPYGVNELAEAGLTAAPSRKVAPPRIAESPVSMECVKREIVPLGDSSLIIGQVVAMHIRDELVLDPVRCYVDTPNLKLIGRMHGGGWYLRTSDRFDMPRLTKAKAAVE
jgi:flavin reductase (DIM6/NTAB) family NADH-FMN oxidoreductase RutF